MAPADSDTCSDASASSGTARSAPSKAPPLTGTEVAIAAGAVTATYGGLLYALHRWHGDAQPTSDGLWGTLPSAWDHPEPNYVVSNAIGEFWSVLTTIPVAGVLLMYEGLKYGYGGKVLSIYALTCGMYSLAFSAHLTLQKLVFSTTVVAVMSNALLTFAQFSYVVHKLLLSRWVRGAIVLLGELALIATVAHLPYALEANGGVWTLFVVQSPGVFLATGISALLVTAARTPAERTTYKTVCMAGSLLSTAMVLSLVECMYGFEYAERQRSDYWGFPWLHICIHVFEQVGIYIFGVGVAQMHELLLQAKPREGAEVRWLGGWMVYLYCPYAPEPAGVSGPAAPLKAGGSAEELEEVPAGAGPQAGKTAAAGADAAAAPGAAQGVHRRARNATPGAPARRSAGAAPRTLPTVELS